MKPDGTYTVDEILHICQDQLQSWELVELANKLVGYDVVIERIRDMDIDELEDATGYYIYDDEPESDIDDFATSDLVDELVDRLEWQTITKKSKSRLLNALDDVNVI